MKLQRLALFALATAALSLAAGIDGKWTGEINTPNGAVQLTMQLKAEGDTLTGTIGTHMGEQVIKEGKIKGDELSWFTVFERDGNSMKIMNTAKVSGSEMKVTITVEGRDGPPMEYTAKKAS
ncbi:MAG: hypothetical protein ACKV2U_01040 [Bryobacteraceae bacterium]